MICDLAETYHVLNYQELSPVMVATLVLGLRDNSRVKMKISASRLTLGQALMTMILDDLNFLSWTKTKSAQKNKNRPKSIYKKLSGEDDKPKEELQVFATPEEYEAYMKQKREEWANNA